MKDLNVDAMENAIKEVITLCGIGVLTDVNKFQDAVKDLLHSSTFAIEQELVIFTVRIGIGEKLLNTVNRSVSEQKRVLGIAKILLTAEYGFCKERSDNILNAFASALGWQYIMHDSVLPQNKGFPGSRINIGTSRLTKGAVIPFGEYKWRVMCVKENAALLIADEITDIGIPYNDTVCLDGVTWEECSLRRWLNTEFLQRFSKEQKKKIILKRVQQEANPWFQTCAGNQTKDRVFLLSISEVIQYFGGEEQLKMELRSSEIAKVGSEDLSGMIDDQFNVLRQAAYKGDNTWWWLRTPGASDTKAAYVNTDGIISLKGETVFDDGGTSCVGIRPGVRPAIWLRQ